MPVMGVPTQRVREVLIQPTVLWADVVVFVLIGGIAGGLLTLAKQVTAPYYGSVEIDLSVWRLPKYTLLSLGRGSAAYSLSLIFTLIYGTFAAYDGTAVDLVARGQRMTAPRIGDVVKVNPQRTYIFDSEGAQLRLS